MVYVQDRARGGQPPHAALLLPLLYPSQAGSALGLRSPSSHFPGRDEIDKEEKIKIPSL